MTLPDIAKGKVLPELTDEALRSSESTFSSEFSRLLLGAPATQRENVLIEVDRRAVVSGSRGWSLVVKNIEKAMRAVLAENGWLT